MAPSLLLKVVVSALGGQGGGVVSDWLLHAAKVEGFLAQSTSVPGVAQRTGATIYYLEFFPRRALLEGETPIMALMPHPGDVDVVIASELMEAGRAIQRGIVTRDKTILIASSHRIYAISEKAQMGDGRANADRVIELARDNAKRLILCDMQAIASAHGSVISAAMLGALAGSNALPFSLASYRQAISAGGIAVKQSLAAFDAAVVATAPAPANRVADVPAVVYRTEELPAVLKEAIRRIPDDIRRVVAEGVRRLVDYQDVSYAHTYLQRLEHILDFERPRPEQAKLAESLARCLALWMSFEDTIRVADLKIRASRSHRVHTELAVSPNQLVYVSEFMKPRVEEICGTLPAALGRTILRSSRLSRVLGRFTRGRQIQTSRMRGFLLLFWLAGLRRYRRRTLRFAEEDARIRAWLALVEQAAGRDLALAAEIAECQTLVKGYGDTHERGWRNFELINARARELLGDPLAATHIRNLRLAALADDEGNALRAALGFSR